MDEYYIKYARPLGKLSVYEMRQQCEGWRNNLREELEGLIYLRNSLNSDNSQSKNFEIIFKKLN